MEYDVKQIPVCDLIEYANNPRKNDHVVDKIAAAIREFGFRIPIIAKSDGTVVDGHLRLKAAKKLKLEKVPVLNADDMTETQIKAFRISVNKMSDLADWDEQVLALELSELQDLDFDLSLTGFDNDELTELLKDDEAKGLTDEDAVPELAGTPISQEGDIWVLGNHRVMCGDSTDAGSVALLMDGAKLNSIITDPPYGIGMDGQKKSISKNPKHNRKTHEFRGWDNQRPPKEVFDIIMGFNCPSVIWGGNYFADLLPATRGWIYWSKGQDGLTMSDGELAWTTENKPLRSKTVNRGELKGSTHPTQKPLSVIEYSLEYISTPTKGNVLDLFGGSGTTLICCEKHDFKCFMMELDPKYVDVIIKRWQDYTGKQATLEGETFEEVSDRRA